MRYNISHIFGVLVGIPVAFLTSIFGMIALDVSFLIDMSIGIVGFLMTYLPIQKLTSRKYLNEIGLTRKDYRYIRNQLNHTHQKLRGILKTYVNIRSIKDFRQIKVEGFFYSHIDNALNLVDAYTRLAKMPKKSINEQQKLEQTRITLDEVKRTLIADLKRLNEDDYERLDIEMELNKLHQKHHQD